MNGFINALLNFAHAIAPRDTKLWLEDMRHEAEFIPNKLSWSLSALGMALRWRLTQIFTPAPSRLAFASLAVAAIATLLIVPNLKNKTVPSSVTQSSPITPAPTVTAATPTTEISNDNASVSRSAEAQILPAENDIAAATPGPEAIPPTLPDTRTNAEAVSGPVAPTVPTAQAITPNLSVGETTVQDDSAEANAATSESPGQMMADDTDSALDANQMTRPAASTDATKQLTYSEPGVINSEAESTTQVSEIPAMAAESQSDIESVIEGAIEQEQKKDELAVLSLTAPSVDLKIIKEVTLEIRQGTTASDPLLFSGTTQAGQTLVYTLPIYVAASDGAALEVYSNKTLEGFLGNSATIRVIQSAP
jgi:hypothetical protein